MTSKSENRLRMSLNRAWRDHHFQTSVKMPLLEVEYKGLLTYDSLVVLTDFMQFSMERKRRYRLLEFIRMAFRCAMAARWRK